MNNSFSRILPILALLSIVGILYIGLLRIDRYLTFRGIQDCAMAARIEQTSENTKVTYPLRDLYEECLSKKSL